MSLDCPIVCMRLRRTERLALTASSTATTLARMQVQIRLFAGLRERAGTDALTLELPDGALCRDALDELSLADRGYAGGAGRQPRVRLRRDGPASRRRAGADPAGLGRCRATRRSTSRSVASRSPPTSVTGAGHRSARRRDRHLPRRHARGARARVRGLRGDGAGEDRGDRRGRGRTPRAVRRCGRAPDRDRAALGAVGRDRRLRAAPSRSLRGRARDHRHAQAPGADLEARGGRVGPDGQPVRYRFRRHAHLSRHRRRRLPRLASLRRAAGQGPPGDLRRQPRDRVAGQHRAPARRRLRPPQRRHHRAVLRRRAARLRLPLRLAGLADRLPADPAADAEGRLVRDAPHARARQAAPRPLPDGVDQRGLRRPAGAPAARELLGSRQPDRAARRLRRGQALLPRR